MVNNTSSTIEKTRNNTWQKNAVLEGARGVSDKIVWLLDLSENDSLLSILKKYNFIKYDESGIKADFSNIKFTDSSHWNKLLSVFLKDCFWKNYYIKGLYKNISVLNNIYEKSIKNTDIINLWNEFIEVPEEWYEYYFEPFISTNKDSVRYSFPPRVNYDMDKFIANLYKKWVYYGFDVEQIDAWIHHSAKWNRENRQFIIAKQKDAEDGVDSILEIISPKVKQDLRSKDIVNKWLDSMSKIDIYSYINATFDVESHERLFRKTKATKGRPWRDITGWIIKNKEWIDNIKLEEILWEWLEIQEIDWETIVLPTRSWTLQKDVHTKKYIVTDWYIVKQVDVKTWDIKIEWEDKTFLVDWDVAEWRTITWDCKKIEVKWNLFGKIEVSWKTEIIISWNMRWRSSLKHNWTWGISIWWIISNLSTLDAKKTDVKIWELQSWNIFANTVELETFLNWKIVAKKINIRNLTIRERSNVSLVWEKIHITNLDSPWILKLSLMSKFITSLEEKKKNDFTISSKREEIKNIVLNNFNFIDANLINSYFLDTIDHIKQHVEKYIKSYSWKLKLLGLNEQDVHEKYKVIIANIMKQLPPGLQNRSYIFKRNILRAQIFQQLKSVEDSYKEIESIYSEISTMKWIINQTSTVMDTSFLYIENHTKKSNIELYNYIYKTKTGDFYDLEIAEINALANWTRLVDDFILSRINLQLWESPLKYSPTKK